MFTRVCFRDQVLISTILATLITLLKAVAMAQPMSTQQLQRFMRDPDNADEPLKYVWDFLNENPMQPDPWPVGLYTWVEFRRETLRDVKELYKFTGNPWPDVNMDDLLISLGYEKRKVYRTFYVFKDGVRLVSHWRLFDHERRLEEYADMEPAWKVMKKPASKKTMKKSMKKTVQKTMTNTKKPMKKTMKQAMKKIMKNRANIVQKALKVIDTSGITKLNITSVKRVLSIVMKRNIGKTQSHLRWSEVVHIVKGKWDLSMAIAEEWIEKCGFKKKRMDHNKSINGISKGNYFMIER